MSYVPHTDADRAEMLRVIGVERIEDLFTSVPETVRLKVPLNTASALDEHSLTRHLAALASRNIHLDSHLCFLGAGIYDHFIPAVVDTILSRGEFLTAYTPYQPEVSQGMLQSIYEYQSLICDLTGMGMANASMYDGATALAEAALMAVDITERDTIIVSGAVHPHYREVLQTYVRVSGYHLLELPHQDGVTPIDRLKEILDDRTAGVIIQHPNFFGSLEDMSAYHDILTKTGALSVVCVDPISLGLLKPPGEYGADIVVGEGQSLGGSPGFGGPLLGFFACKNDYLRKFPGRIVGATTDHQGRRGYTMTLRTREQDIRREKATSNICTNEALMALAATVYLCEVGKHGLRQVADLSLQKAHYTRERLCGLPGVEPRFHAACFKEFAVRLPGRVSVRDVNHRLMEMGILGGFELGSAYPDLADSMLICVTETKSKDDLDRLVSTLHEVIR